MFGDMWAETYGAYRDYHVDPEDLIQNYECSRCGRRGKSSDADAHEWHNINICEADANIWHEENDSTLCPDCSKKFNDIWFDFIVTKAKIKEVID